MQPAQLGARQRFSTSSGTRPLAKGGGETTVATYDYEIVTDNDGGTETPGNLASAALLDKTIDYTNPTDEFVASITGTEFTHHYYDPGSGLVTQSTALSENLTFGDLTEVEDVDFAPPASTLATSGSVYNIVVTDENAQVGNGVDADPLPYSAWIRAQYPDYQEGRFWWGYFDAGTDTASWLSFNPPQNEWEYLNDDNSQPFVPLVYLDARGGWKVSEYSDAGAGAHDGATTFPNLVELTKVKYGASDIDGSSPLMTKAFTYTYGNKAMQLKSTESQDSVINGGHTASTAYAYDADNRLKSEIRHGWTRTFNGTTWSTTERYVGTFYFKNHACLSDSDDSQDRTLEVHGPCLLSGSGSTDCDNGGIVPITQYFYNAGSYTDAGGGPESNQLQKVRRFTDNSGTTCSGAHYVDTTFDSYGADPIWWTGCMSVAAGFCLVDLLLG